MNAVENVLPRDESVRSRSDAFISYSRRDKAFAVQLERALEKYRPPRDLPVPQRYLEIYRDEEDFSGGGYLAVLREYLGTSAKLIVLCSPSARNSQYVGEEIRMFVELHGSSADIIPILIAGLPNNEVVAGQEAEAAFPQALCDLMGMPLAIDFRGAAATGQSLHRGSFERAWFALLASLYGIARGEIEQRERKRQLRTRNSWICGLSVVAFGFAALTVWALYSRADAVNQGRIAEERRKTATAAQLVAESRRNDRLESLALAAEANAIQESSVTKANLVQLIEHYWHVESVTWDEPGTWHPLARSPDSRWVATGTRGGKVQLRRYPNGELVEPLDTDGSAVVSLAISGNGQLIAAGDYAGVLRVWRLDDRTLIAKLGRESEDFATTIALNADGSHLIAARGSNIEIWSVAGQSVTRTLDNESEINSLALNRDETLLAVGSDDNRVRLWNMKTSKLLWTLNGHNGEVEAVAFGPDGKTFASAGGDRTIRLWSWPGKPTSIPLDGSQDFVRTVAFDDTGKRLISGGRDGVVRLWDLDAKKEINLGMQGQNVEAAAFLSNGDHVVTSGTDGSVVVWDLGKTSAFASTLQQHRIGAQIFALAVSRAGTLVASGADDGFVRLWDMQAANPADAERSVHIGGAIKSLATSLDNRYIAAGTETGEIEILDTFQLSRVAPTTLAHKGAVHALAFHPSGRWLVSGGADKRVKVWDLPNLHESTRNLPVADAAIRAVDFSSTGDRLALGLDNGQISSWRWGESEISLAWRQSRNKSGVSAIGFSPNDQLLLSTGMTGDNAASFANADDGHETRRQGLGPGGIADGHFFTATDRLVFARAKGAVVMDYPSLETVASINVAVERWASRANFLKSHDLIVLAGGNRVFTFDISTANLLGHACRIAGRSVMDSEWGGLVGTIEQRKVDCEALSHTTRQVPEGRSQIAR